MPVEYSTRKLPRVREYPAYQFYATLEYKGQTAESCFCYAALTVTDWLKERLENTGMVPEEIRRLPNRSCFADVTMEDFKSFRVNSGFTADVIALPKQKLWTLRLKEPDSKTEGREVVPGRFFITNVGITIGSNQQVEFGIHIDVTDPENAPEVEYAFRPKFIRYLFAEGNLSVRQETCLKYNTAVPVETDDQFKVFRGIIESTRLQMPVVVFTQAVNVPEFKPEGFFSLNRSNSPFRENPFIQETPTPMIKTFYPFDADDFAGHAFGYALTCKATEKMHDQISKRIHKQYNPGDILLIEPRRFGGAVRVFEQNEPDVALLLKGKTRSFSKHKNYDFGNVQYEYDARNILAKEQIEEVRQSTELAAAEKFSKLNQMIQDLQLEGEKKTKKIEELKDQNLLEFERGEQAERERNEELLRSYDELERQYQASQALNLQLKTDISKARSYQQAAEQFRTLAVMPQTCADVVSYFEMVFGDRIAFTEKGKKTAGKCDIRADGLWFYLFHMANTLFDLHHDNTADIERAFMEATGIEIALGESKKSHKSNAIMRTREDVWQGKTISIEPHVKLVSQKAGTEHQRIYYCYDHEEDQIIIGHIGDHLINAATQYAK